MAHRDLVVPKLVGDRSTDPFLRSYLWAHPAGIDKFATLADEATIGRVLRRTFERDHSAQLS